MSRLDELIAELCPDGVDYKPLLSVTNVLYGFPCDASLFNTDGVGTPLARIRDVNSGFSETFTTESIPQKYILSSGDLLIGMDGNFHVSSWKQEGAVLCQRVCKVFSKDETLLLNGFLAHLMKPIILKIENNKQSGTVKHLLDKDIKAIIIPVPPLPIQQGIIKILDTFTRLSTELKMELLARKKQYVYYRDLLLSFRDLKNIDVLSLEAVTVFIRNGYNYKADGDRTKRYKISRIETISTGQINMEKVGSTDSINDSYRLSEGDILFSHINSLPYLGNTAYYSAEYGELYHGMNLLCFRSNETIISPKYLYYYMKSSMMRKNIERYAKQSCNQYSLSISTIKKWKIPVPSLQQQNRIVSFLEKFDNICNNSQNGLPMEIELRQKQYEYYREKLLEFEKKEGV